MHAQHGLTLSACGRGAPGAGCSPGRRLSRGPPPWRASRRAAARRSGAAARRRGPAPPSRRAPQPPGTAGRQAAQPPARRWPGRRERPACCAGQRVRATPLVFAKRNGAKETRISLNGHAAWRNAPLGKHQLLRRWRMGPSAPAAPPSRRRRHLCVACLRRSGGPACSIRLRRQRRVGHARRGRSLCQRVSHEAPRARQRILPCFSLRCHASATRVTWRSAGSSLKHQHSRVSARCSVAQRGRGSPVARGRRLVACAAPPSRAPPPPRGGPAPRGAASACPDRGRGSGKRRFHFLRLPSVGHPAALSFRAPCRTGARRGRPP